LTSINGPGRLGPETGRILNNRVEHLMYAKILVPVDASETSDAGLDEAIRLARLCGARLRLLHVSDDLPFVPEAALYQAEPQAPVSDGARRGSALLARLADQVTAQGIEVDTVLLESRGQALHGFVNEQARAWGAELVVLGTHGRRGIERAFVGSVAEQVVRHADVPVLLVRRMESVNDTGLQSIAAAIA
jgi:nucleotide-binding universal stress UspA family protein